MNDTTLLLAQLLGPTLAIIGLGLVVQKEFYLKLYKNIFEPNLSYLLMLLVMIPIGISIVMSHFLWGSLAEILVSLVGLAILGKGAILAISPNTLKGITNSVVSSGILPIGGFVWLIGGGYLTYVGFFT
jgi:hypothetical protein